LTNAVGQLLYYSTDFSFVKWKIYAFAGSFCILREINLYKR